jgi:hypothetical protein
VRNGNMVIEDGKNENKKAASKVDRKTCVKL